MVAVETSLRRVDVPFHDPDPAIGRRNEVAQPYAGAVGDPWAEKAGGDRLVLCPDPHPVVQDRSPGGKDVVHATGLRTDIACPRFATQDPDARRQIAMV